MQKSIVAVGAVAVLVLAACGRTREVVYTPAPAAMVAPPAIVVVDTPPPAPREETPPPAPSAGAVWVPGYWSWANGKHEWVPGRWETARSGYAWVPHQWQLVDGRWQLTGGTWVRQQ